MANTILFVFEGEGAEKRLLESFKRYYFKEPDRSLVTATFNTSIYSLYAELKDDEFLDVVELLRERSEANRVSLEGISREDISEVYLFFDHDGHASNAADDKVQVLLEHFQEETEQGKLYISYPMIEAVKHLSASLDFESLTAEICNNKAYKGRVSSECESAFKHLHELDQDCWFEINRQHCMKAWCLLTGEFELPAEVISQEAVFNAQLEKHIEPSECVAVLSAFPLLLLEYYGVSKLLWLVRE